LCGTVCVRCATTDVRSANVSTAPAVYSICVLYILYTVDQPRSCSHAPALCSMLMLYALCSCSMLCSISRCVDWDRCILGTCGGSYDEVYTTIAIFSNVNDKMISDSETVIE
jgi:hypothetical protein